MSKSLQVTVRESKKDGTFEGIAQLEGGTSFKLTKSRSTDTRFSTRSSLTQSAKTFAKRFGLELDIAAKATAKAASKTATNGCNNPFGTLSSNVDTGSLTIANRNLVVRKNL